MKSLSEKHAGTCTLGKDGMYCPNLMIEETDQQLIGKWGRMQTEYLEEQHPSLYQRLLLNGTLGRHLADASKRAAVMLESLIAQMVSQEGITEQCKVKQPVVWAGRMNSIRSRTEEIVREKNINPL